LEAYVKARETTEEIADAVYGMTRWQLTTMRQMAVVAVLLLVACGRVESNQGDASIDVPGLDGPPQFTSCTGLAANCGAGANESCCQAGTVPGTDPGSPFYRSYDVAPDTYNDMSSPATVSAFVLDRYEVTIGRFRAFVNAGLGTQESPPVAGSGAHPKLGGSGWDSAWNTSLAANRAALLSTVKCDGDSKYQTWTDVAGANENMPMNCVTWYEAMAFCIWDGGYLPTELEWNYAASGGSEQRAYPWSDPPISTSVDCTYANYKINSPAGKYCVNETTGGTNRVGSESPGGDGRWGHSALAGNVWEWTLDWYASMYPNPCDDCANLAASSDHVIRGGSFLDHDASLLRAAHRGRFLSPDYLRYYNVGLRCARSAP
jgi:formylglycine-generating enzyme